MEKIERKQERKFFISVIVLLLVTCYAVTTGLVSEINDLKTEKQKCDDWVEILESSN